MSVESVCVDSPIAKRLRTHAEPRAFPCARLRSRRVLDRFVRLHRIPERCDLDCRNGVLYGAVRLPFSGGSKELAPGNPLCVHAVLRLQRPHGPEPRDAEGVLPLYAVLRNGVRMGGSFDRSRFPDVYRHGPSARRSPVPYHANRIRPGERDDRRRVLGRGGPVWGYCSILLERDGKDGGFELAVRVLDRLSARGVVFHRRGQALYLGDHLRALVPDLPRSVDGQQDHLSRNGRDGFHHADLVQDAV